jgi:hypothetical protein
LRHAGGYPRGLIIGLTNNAPESHKTAELPYAVNTIGALLREQLLFRSTTLFVFGKSLTEEFICVSDRSFQAIHPTFRGRKFPRCVIF